MILSGLVLLVTPVAAGLHMDISYSGYYSDNIFLNASAVKDYVSQLQTSLYYSLEKFNIYVDAGADLYFENPDFNSFTLEPGIEFLHYLKKEGRSALYMDLSFQVLSYNELYQDFNYIGPAFQAGLKLYTSPQSLLRLGYFFQYRYYTNYASFDFVNQTFYLEWNQFFASQTTLRLQAGMNYRYYPHVADIIETTDDYNYYDHNGQGPGNGNSNGTGSGSGSGQSSTSQASHSLAVPNAYGLLRLAQGIGTRFGITLEAEYRHNFRALEDADALIKNAYIIYPYNDSYLWDGLRFTLILKSIIGKEIALTGTFSYFAKDYPGNYVMDAAGEIVEPMVQREDKLLFYQLNISKKLRKLDFFANVSYRDNDSNDTYFFYHMLTVSLGIGFFF